VAKLVGQYGIDAGHVFANGMSNGAFMTNRLGCERADVFAAIAPVAGTSGVNVGCAPSRPVAVLAIHGTADPLVPFTGGPMTGRAGPATIVSAPAMAQRWRELDGRPDPPTEDTLPSAATAPPCTASPAAPAPRFGSGVHASRWRRAHLARRHPVFAQEAIIGPTPHAFDASEASWQFFAGHPR
jgi:polyhydroxybutyrate depolymerase